MRRRAAVGDGWHVGVVTVLAEETRAVLEVFGLGGGRRFHTGRMAVPGGVTYLVVAPPAGVGGVAAALAEVCGRYDPPVVVLVSGEGTGGGAAGLAGDAPKPADDAAGLAGEAPKPTGDAAGLAGSAPKPADDAAGLAGHAAGPASRAPKPAGDAANPPRGTAGPARHAASPAGAAAGLAGDVAGLAGGREGGAISGVLLAGGREPVVGAMAAFFAAAGEPATLPGFRGTAPFLVWRGDGGGQVAEFCADATTRRGKPLAWAVIRGGAGRDAAQALRYLIPYLRPRL